MADTSYFALPIQPDEGFPQAFRLAFNNALYTVALYVSVPEEELRPMPDDGALELGAVFSGLYLPPLAEPAAANGQKLSMQSADVQGYFVAKYGPGLLAATGFVTEVNAQLQAVGAESVPPAFTLRSFMVMRVTREAAAGPRVIFFRKLVANLAYAAVELSFWFGRIHIAKQNINGVGAFGSVVEGHVGARWAL